jgi:hypothetical protein
MRVKPWQIFKASISIFWAQRWFFVRIAAVPTLSVIAAFALYVAYLIFSDVNGYAGTAALFALVLLIPFIFYQIISFCISWYRYRANLETRVQWIRTDVRRHFKMLWIMFAMMFFVGGPLFLAFMLHLLTSSLSHILIFDIVHDMTLPLAILPAIGWLIIASARLCLVLPAAALDEPMTLLQSFRETNGNGLRVIALYFLLQLIGIPSRVIDATLSDFDISLSATLMLAALNMVILWVTIAISVIAASEVYRTWLVSKMEPQAAEAGVSA